MAYANNDDAWIKSGRGRLLRTPVTGGPHIVVIDQMIVDTSIYGEAPSGDRTPYYFTARPWKDVPHVGSPEWIEYIPREPHHQNCALMPKEHRCLTCEPRGSRDGDPKPTRSQCGCGDCNL